MRGTLNSTAAKAAQIMTAERVSYGVAVNGRSGFGSPGATTVESWSPPRAATAAGNSQNQEPAPDAAGRPFRKTARASNSARTSIAARDQGSTPPNAKTPNAAIA